MTENSSLAWYVVPSIIAIFIFLVAILIEYGARKNNAIKKLSEILRSGSFLDATVLSIAVGLLLIVSGFQQYLFAPGIALNDSLIHTVFSYAQIVVGIGLVLGTFTRICTIGIIGLFVSGFFFFPPLKILDYSVFLGIGLFLFIIHKDVLSFTFFFHPVDKQSFLDRYRKYAFPILRFLTGVGLIMIFLHHHILSPQPAIDFLTEKPLLNIMQSIFGLEDFSHNLLIFNTGIFGILIGLLLALGILERFIATIIAFGLLLTILVGGAGFLPIAIPYFAIIYVVITGNQFQEREIKEKP